MPEPTLDRGGYCDAAQRQRATFVAVAGRNRRQSLRLPRASFRHQARPGGIETEFHQALTMTNSNQRVERSVTASAQAILGPTPLLEIENEPAPALIVDPPLPGPLLRGKVFIQYRAEHIRIVPVFGKGALQVSPRVGHVHITVDSAPWHFVDASGDTVIIVGLAPGAHKILFELADPTHRVITGQTIHFEIPADAIPHS